MSKPKIGFIGLGLMGAAMCKRLQDLGYPLNVVVNRSRTNIDKAIARGAVEYSSSRELAANSDFVMLCMDTSASVEGRMFGENGVIAGLQKGSVVIDFGTSLPASTKAIGEKVNAAGAGYLDGPLGRTPAHAEDGLLNIMCSGDMVAFEKIKPVLEDLGENVFHLGALGSGHTIKLMNNFYGMTCAMAMSEVFAMADVAGIERKQVYDVMAAGPLRSGMMDFVAAYGVDGDPTKLEFAVKNARKDVGYYATMADDAGVPSIMSQGTKHALSLGVAAKYGEQMVSEMVDYFANLFSSKKD